MIPYFSVSGTHYEVGRQVGERFRDAIVDYYDLAMRFGDVVFPFVQTEKGEKVYSEFLRAVESHYPQYVAEMQGLADGAGLTFKQVFTMHITRELNIAIAVKKEWGCSDLFINYPQTGQVALGHNEDIDPMVKSRAYVLHVTILEEDQKSGVKTTVEEFTSYVYPGHLPGSAFNYNSAGMIFNCNGLPPQLISYGKIPRYVVNRAMITAKTPAEFEETLQCKGVGSAYGFSVNVVQMREERPVFMWNYEVAPVADSPSTLVHRVSIGAEGDTETDKSGYYFHCNRYQHMSVPEIEALTRSSRGRLARFDELPVPKTIEDIIGVMEDEADGLYPIFRTPRPTDRSATVAMAIYDFKKNQVSIYEDKPSRCKPDLILAIPSGQPV